MILLRDPAILFLKPHKVAGTSFEIALSQFARPADIVTPIGQTRGAPEAALRGFKPANYRYTASELVRLPLSEWRWFYRRGMWPVRFRSHSSAIEVRQRLPDDDWHNAHKLSIVRNPFDVAVSAYFWMRREDQSFEDFWLRNPHLLTRNQAKYCIEGHSIIDSYLRYEHMAEDIAALERRFPALRGLAKHFQSLSMKSGYRPADATSKAIFDTAPTIRKLVEKHCRFEIESFGYTPE